jgi:hypothetical protein
LIAPNVVQLQKRQHASQRCMGESAQIHANCARRLNEYRPEKISSCAQNLFKQGEHVIDKYELSQSSRAE